MDRRQFLSTLMASGALYGAGGLPFLARPALATAFPDLGARNLVHVSLVGGPDFRHLFPPAYDDVPGSFGAVYWQAMASAHDIAASESAKINRWTSDYVATAAGDTEFGILSGCGWLRDMWEAGHVAIIANVLGSSSRNHHHSLLVLENGSRSATPGDFGRSGWGGRLAAAAGRNVLALTQVPRRFCYGEDPVTGTRSDEFMISATDTRAMSLYSTPAGDSPTWGRTDITRALTGYYAARRDMLGANPRFDRFVEHEMRLREFGAPIEERLSSIPVPDPIAQLYTASSANELNDNYFGRQIRNLYDSLACADILNLGVASLEYKGWDSHKHQREQIEPGFLDLFGHGRALDALFQSLPDSVLDDTVCMLHGEFGRQIRANGGKGTDHGEGTVTLLIGRPVNGGVYGDLFPQAEIARQEERSPQIEGLTAIEPLFARVADWLVPGGADAVFPGWAQAPIEPGVDLDALLT
jgi:uncharacterized protein (DUF1501 family)